MGDASASRQRALDVGFGIREPQLARTGVIGCSLCRTVEKGGNGCNIVTGANNVGFPRVDQVGIFWFGLGWELFFSPDCRSIGRRSSVATEMDFSGLSTPHSRSKTITLPA